MKKIIHVAGKRKRAIARATLREGKGVIRINKMILDAYSPDVAKMMIQEPLQIAGDYSSKVDIDIDVNGGGWHSQAEAARLVVARALVEFSGNKKLKQDMLDYDRHLLIPDLGRQK
ncbi:MAG: 30S ribosomal protein S9, partial [Nanoarchaeota archaeon]